MQTDSPVEAGFLLLVESAGRYSEVARCEVRALIVSLDRQVCQWQLLRESCLVPPSWNNAHAARKPAKGEEKEQGQHSECYLPTVRHTLTREKGIDYLELPLFPYTDQADSGEDFFQNSNQGAATTEKDSRV